MRVVGASDDRQDVRLEAVDMGESDGTVGPERNHRPVIGPVLIRPIPFCANIEGGVGLEIELDLFLTTFEAFAPCWFSID